MSKETVLPILFSETFKLGRVSTDLVSLLGEQTIKKINLKFSENSVQELHGSLREVIRFLYLSAYAPSSVFFPGDKLVDDLWHTLITETKDYRNLCNKLKPGCFIDHTGTTFEDYKSTKTNEEVNIEQLSWLASYVKNFDEIDEIAFHCLTLSKELSQRAGGGLKELNMLGRTMLELSNQEPDKDSNFNLAYFLENDVLPYSTSIDSDPAALEVCLRKLILGLAGNIRMETDLPSNEDLESIFGASTSLAFTLWQHLAAVERLQALESWQQKHPVVWNSIVKGEKICGLATTHLAKPGGAGILATLQSEHYLLSGKAPWVCGFGIFDLLLIGFETDSEVVFALTEFPNEFNIASMNAITYKRHQMICLNGTSTVNMTFNQKIISFSDIVSSRTKMHPPLPRKSKFVIPELGIGKAAINESVKIITGSKHPRHQLVNKSVLNLKNRLAEIEEMRSSESDLTRLVFLRDEFNRDAIRLLTLAMGAEALNRDSLPAKLSLETILLDSVVQAPATLELKISHTGKRL